MGNGIALTEKLQQEILELPQETLPELETFIEFLRFKAKPRKSKRAETNPPLKIVNLRGILKGYDFSPEFIAEARREMWRKFYIEEAE
jgi:hypothetical protein